MKNMFKMTKNFFKIFEVECDIHPKNGLKRRLTTKKRKKQTVHPFREHGLLAVRPGIFAGKNDPVRRAKAVRINETVCA